MKKLFAFLFLSTALAIPALAGVTDLNSAVKTILAAFNNPVTMAQLTFDDVQVNAERALSLKAHGAYRKMGTANVLGLNINEISYNYGDGTAPLSVVDGSVDLDLLKIIPQTQINEMAPMINEILADLARNLGKDYGDALAVEAKVLEKNVNEKGDLTSIKARIAVKFDLAKLPANKPADDEEITEGSLEFTLGIHGAAINVRAISNPLYKGFRKDEDGLKEILQKLLALDRETIEKIASAAKSLDDSAATIVNDSMQH